MPANHPQAKRLTVNHTFRALQRARNIFRLCGWKIGHAHVIATLFQHLIDRRLLLRIVDEQRAGFYNIAFIRGNFFHRIAEHRHVIERYMRHNSGLRAVNDIGRIKTPAESNLQHDNITALFEEIQHRARGGKFKLTDTLPFRQL